MKNFEKLKMATAGANAIGLLVEKFQEFLEWIFEPKRKSDFEKLRDIDEYLNLAKERKSTIRYIFETHFPVTKTAVRNRRSDERNESGMSWVIFYFLMQFIDKLRITFKHLHEISVLK